MEQTIQTRSNNIHQQVGNQSQRESTRIDRQIQQGIFTPIDHEYYINRKQVLGQGSRGTVYKGIYKKEKKYIAIKFIKQRFYQRQTQFLNDLAKDLHPNIVAFYGHRALDQEGVYYLMQLCEGGTLQQYIVNKVKVNQLEVAEIFEQLLQVMVYLSTQSNFQLKIDIIHRDLKPSKILLDKQNNVKLTGFGLVRQLSILTTLNARASLYQAPEIIFRKKAYDTRCDVWSAGLILYELLTRTQYFNTVKTIKGLKKTITEMQDDNIITVYYPADLDSDWQILTQMMLAFDEKQRPFFKDIYQKYLQIKPTLRQRLKNKEISR